MLTIPGLILIIAGLIWYRRKLQKESEKPNDDD